MNNKARVIKLMAMAFQRRHMYYNSPLTAIVSLGDGYLFPSGQSFIACFAWQLADLLFYDIYMKKKHFD